MPEVIWKTLIRVRIEKTPDVRKWNALALNTAGMMVAEMSDTKLHDLIITDELQDMREL